MSEAPPPVPIDPSSTGGTQKPALEGELLQKADGTGGFANAELPEAIKELITSSPKVFGGVAVGRLLLAQVSQLHAEAAESRRNAASLQDKLDAARTQETETRVKNASLEGQLSTAKGDRKMEKHLLFIGALLFGAGVKYIEQGFPAAVMILVGAALCVVGYMGFSAMRKS